MVDGNDLAVRPISRERGLEIVGDGIPPYATKSNTGATVGHQPRKMLVGYEPG
jgi:hypothetical protein